MFGKIGKGLHNAGAGLHAMSKAQAQWEIELTRTILLKRKKQIERGAWSPEQKGGSPPGDPLPSEGDSNCPKCGGLGHVLIEGGRHAKMCECNKWMRSQRLQ